MNDQIDTTSGALVPVNDDADMLPVTRSAPKEELDKLAGSGFLPYILLTVSTTSQVKQGKILPGRWTFNQGKEKMEDLGESFEALALARRACAKRKTNKGILSYYDQNHNEYKKIELDSKAGGLTGCWYGTEYLVWLPDRKLFAAFHASNATSRTSSKDLNTIIDAWDEALHAEAAKPKEDRQPVPNPQVKFTRTMVKYGNGNENWGPVFTKATTPFSVLPAWKDVISQCAKFSKPPTSKVETAPQASSGAEDMG